MIRKSRVLRDIAAGRVATCIKMNLGDPRVVELAGLAGFSAVWLCNEHVPNEWTNLEHCVRAALYDVDSIVRVAKGSYSDYIKPFECDATGIMVPHVTTADEARAIVDTCRFLPMGHRALDGGNADGRYCQMPMGQYIEYCNRERYLILQIESPEGVENVETIAAVPGYEFLLFGPGDFSHRIGRPGEINLPEVLEARRKVEEAARRHGKKCFAVGVRGTPEELKQRNYYISHLTADVTALGASFAETIKNFGQEVTKTDAYYNR